MNRTGWVREMSVKDGHTVPSRALIRWHGGGPWLWQCFGFLLVKLHVCSGERSPLPKCFAWCAIIFTHLPLHIIAFLCFESCTAFLLLAGSCFGCSRWMERSMKSQILASCQTLVSFNHGYHHSLILTVKCLLLQPRWCSFSHLNKMLTNPTHQFSMNLAKLCFLLSFWPFFAFIR